MDGPSALTRREREVASLVAEGLTNREIGERLVISERTAEGHVEQIRGKLGFHTRAQIASWATAQVLGATAGTPATAAPVTLRRRRRSPLALAAISVIVVVVVAIAIAGSTRVPAPTSSTASSRTLMTVVGLGTAGFSGDGGPATAAQLDMPTSLAFDREGNLYIADTTTNTFGGINITRIRRVDRAGKIVTIAGGGGNRFGNGQADFAPDVRFSALAQLTLDGRGDVYVSQGPGQSNQDAHWIARISDGRVRLVAGNPSGVAAVGPGLGPGAGGGYSGDGGPATGALLRRPRGLVVDPTGNLYFADSGNNVVRRVGADGLITTVAGTGIAGFGGDGGPATAAGLSAPVGVALSPDGSLYIADTNNHRVRRVDHGGAIVTVAGTGVAGFGGDGGPATAAQLNLPAGVGFDAQGRLYIADTSNNRVRVVATDGTITTIAGDGNPDQLLNPSAVAVDASGVIYIADTGNHRIRKPATR